MKVKVLRFAPKTSKMERSYDFIKLVAVEINENNKDLTENK